MYIYIDKYSVCTGVYRCIPVCCIDMYTYIDMCISVGSAWFRASECIPVASSRTRIFASLKIARPMHNNWRSPRLMFPPPSCTLALSDLILVRILTVSSALQICWSACVCVCVYVHACVCKCECVRVCICTHIDSCSPHPPCFSLSLSLCVHCPVSSSPPVSLPCTHSHLLAPSLSLDSSINRSYLDISINGSSIYRGPLYTERETEREREKEREDTYMWVKEREDTYMWVPYIRQLHPIYTSAGSIWYRIVLHNNFAYLCVLWHRDIPV